MPNAPEYSIARDYDPGQEILSAESDPMAAYLTYLADVTVLDALITIFWTSIGV